jgi:hypothetical protein
MEAVNTLENEMRLEDAFMSNLRNFPATHHVMTKQYQIVCSVVRLDDNELQ